MIARRSALVVAMMLATLATSPAKAWTRARIAGAAAEVEIEQTGTANVLLDLSVRVDAGWLAELELSSLGAEVTLAEPTVRFHSEHGRVHRATATVDPDTGSVRLVFERSDAPTQGLHRATVRYTTNLIGEETVVVGGNRARVSWTMPAWEHSIEDVQITVTGPPDMVRSTPDADLPAGTTFSSAPRQTGVAMTWRRVHLPRASAWSVALEIPVPPLSAAPSAAAEAPQVPRLRAAHPLGSNAPHLPTFLFVLLVLWKRTTLGKRRPLIRHAAAVSVLVLSAIAVAIVGSNHPWLWCVAWMVLCPVAFGRPSHARPGDGATLTRKSVSLRHASPSTAAPLDITTTLGQWTAFVICGVLLASGYTLEALGAITLFVVNTRLDHAPPVAEQASMLRTFVSNLRWPQGHGAAVSAVQLDDKDAVREIRVALCHAGELSGLRHLEFVVATCSRGWVQRRTVKLHVCTRAETPADDALRPLLDGVAQRAGSLTMHRWLVPPDLAADIFTMLERLQAKAAPSDSGTWLLQAMSQRTPSPLSDAA